MADVIRMRGRAARLSLDSEDSPASSMDVTVKKAHWLDSAEMRKEHRRLLQWLYYELDRQSTNRLEMAIDADYYDSVQWDEQDAEIVAQRNQMPLVYNAVASVCDWISGTERRQRADWAVLPRSEDDVQAADVKTKVLKYQSDVNKVPWHRSRAFSDAVKSGIGWVDDGVRDDPTKSAIYSGYEDWRNVLDDSTALDPYSDQSRYRFRWRWVDEDIAYMMFPDRQEIIRRAIEDWGYHFDPLLDDQELARPGNLLDGRHQSGTLYPIGRGATVAVDGQRRRVKIYECQYRKPTNAKVVADGPFRGRMFDPRDRIMAYHLGQLGSTLIDKVALRMHVSAFTESALLAWGPSAYRHNRFSLTPVVAYRNGRTRQVYGVIRRVRGVQDDVNKRASKAQFLLNTNQLFGEEGAVEDWDEAQEQAQDPQGRIVHKQGYKLEVRRDSEQATGQIQLMELGLQTIQKVGGVTDENLGRETNARSGKAIEARQLQGAVVTTELFDNLRMAVQHQGENQLSLCEQYLTEETVIRLTGARGGIEWSKINQITVDPDGKVRVVNDITASQADFVVREADYSGTLRQVMFESMNNLAQRLPPEVGLRFLRIAYEYSDLPNKDEIAGELRRLTGEQDPNKPMTPEEADQARQQMQQQAEAMEVQRQTAIGVLEEQQAKVREINARVEKALAEVEQLRAGGDPDAERVAMELKIERAVGQVREQAAREIETLNERLRKATADNTTQMLKINREADTAHEIEQIRGATAERVAEIQAENTGALDALSAKLDRAMQALADLGSQLSGAEQRAAEGARKVAQLEQAQVAADAERRAEAAAAKKIEAAAKPAEPAPAAVPQQPIVIVAPPAPVAAPAQAGGAVRFEYDDKGGLAGAVLKRDDGTELRVDVKGAAMPALGDTNKKG